MLAYAPTKRLQRLTNLESIVGYCVAPVGKDQEIHLPVEDDGEEGLAVEVLVAVFIGPDNTASLLTEHKIALLIIVEELGASWAVEKEEEAHDANCNCCNPLENEDLFQTRQLLYRVGSRSLRSLTQRQPARPAVPSILAMAKASKPENAPPVAAEVYRIAMRVCVSFGRYQFAITRIAPGRKPALYTRLVKSVNATLNNGTYSKRPRKKRTARRPA